MRTLIYARFSTDLQNSLSVDDQIAVCRERCVREGWQIAGVYSDAAVSGAAGIDEKARPGMWAMLRHLEGGSVDQVLAEHTDRLSRHPGDAYQIRQQILYAKARLFTLKDGEVTDITATVRSLIDSQFRTDSAAKIKRGQQGSVSRGRSPAGLAYGYRKLHKYDEKGEPIRGFREIDDQQAEIVRLIFKQYTEGKSPKAICELLNAKGVASPSGAKWRASTINGDHKRQNGMLQNQLYIGRLVHNRTSKVTEPVTRKIRIRPNPENEWVREDVPHLRIIDQDIWEATQKLRQRFKSKHPGKARRPKHLLSGLATCGVCGGGWSIIGLNRWGCSRHREGGASACANNRTLLSDIMEKRVLHGLQERMLDPELVRIYVDEYQTHRAKQARESSNTITQLKKRLRDAELKITRFVDAIGNGGGAVSEILAALTKARDERDAITAEIAGAEQLPVIALHPTIIDDYRKQIAELNRALTANPEASIETIPVLRSLIERLIICPACTPRGVTIEIQGKLAAILSLATGNPIPEQCMVVAERVKGIEPSS